MIKQKSLLSVALLACAATTIVSCKKESVMKDNQAKNSVTIQNTNARTVMTTGITVLPQSGWADHYYIVSKLSNKAITLVSEGAQLEQTELTWAGNEPSSKADLTICNFGTVTNPVNFQPGTYTAYKIQWGSINPSTLINHFWDVKNSSSADGTWLISWPSVDQDNQKFVFEPTGDADSSVYIRSLATGKYLQIAGGADVNTSIGAKVEQWTFNRSANQKFFINVRTM